MRLRLNLICGLAMTTSLTDLAVLAVRMLMSEPLWPRSAAARADESERDPIATGIRTKAAIAADRHDPPSFAGADFRSNPLGCPPVGYQDREPLDDAVSHYLLYDGPGPDARLIGVKYLVSDEVYRRMPPEERLYWHVHQCEGDAGLPTSTTKSRSDEITTGARAQPPLGQGVSHLAIGRRLPARAVPALLVGHGRTALGPAPRRPGPVKRPVESSLIDV